MQELTQEQLLNHVDAAIHLLESETGHVATTKEIQAYLRTMGYDEPLERIKWCIGYLAHPFEKMDRLPLQMRSF